jgi:eukaryotic-like serine/threonine-protein kinase
VEDAEAAQSVQVTVVAQVSSLGARFVRSPPGRWLAERAMVEEGVRGRLFGARCKDARLDRYTLVRTLGRGSFGEVWEARDPMLDRNVAIKIARRRTHDRRATERFVREARCLAQLTHPNVVAVYDFGVNERTDGFDAFFVMEQLDVDLRGWLESPRSLSEVFGVFIDAARGLAAAHAIGLVHRDFKPTNVMLGPDGRALVGDFGLALHVGDASVPPTSDEHALQATLCDDERLTGSGCVMGTPRYMAPEQHTGDRVDARADQYAFCAALFEACHGSAPFGVDDVEAMVRRKLSGQVFPVPRRSRIPAELSAIILRGLAPNPNERHDSMQTLTRELERFRARRRLPRRLGTAAAFLAAAVPLSATALSRGSPCADLHQRADRVWSPERAGRLRAAFADSDLEYATTQWEHARASMDAWVDAWHVEADAACRLDSSAPEPPTVARSCLVEALESADALLRALATITPESALHAPASVDRLPRPVGCGTVGEAQTRLEQERLGPAARAMLDDLDALAAVARWDQAAETASRLVETAAGTDDRVLLAAALLRRGAALERLARREAAIEDLERAYFLSLELGRVQDAVNAASLLVLVHGWGNSDASRAKSWAAHGRAALERRPGDAAEAGLATSEAAMYLAAGDFDRAIERGYEAVALHEAVAGSRATGTAGARNILGSALLRAGRTVEGVEQVRAAVSDLEARLGPYHPNVAMATGNLGTALGMAGEHAEAIGLLEQAIAVVVVTRSADDPMAIGYRANLASQRLGVGDASGAIAELEAVLSTSERVNGPGHPDVAKIHNNLGVALAQAGRLDEARSRLEHGLSLYEAIHGSEHPDVVDTLDGLGDVLAALGRTSDAIRVYARGREISERVRGREDPLTVALGTKLAGITAPP